MGSPTFRAGALLPVIAATVPISSMTNFLETQGGDLTGTAAYIGLKQAGHDLGKADFDAIHAYPAGFSFDEEQGKK